MIAPGLREPPTVVSEREAAAMVAYARRASRQPYPGYPPHIEAVAAVWARYCVGCHKIDGDGGKDGPDLSHEGKKHDAATLRRWIEDPELVDPDADMPSFGDRLTVLRSSTWSRHISPRGSSGAAIGWSGNRGSRGLGYDPPVSLNPLQDGLRLEPTPGPTTLVIFGASGDLTRRKLLPALYRLSRDQHLPARFSIVGVAREEFGDEGFRQEFRDSLREFAGVTHDDEIVALALRRDCITSAGISRTRRSTSSSRPKSRRSTVPAACCSTWPSLPAPTPNVIEQLGAAGLARAGGDGWRRIIIEKPFGTDLHTARTLNGLVHRHFDEEQVFRIDHYLGKETVQNLMVFRFANGMFEPVWNRRYIDHVQITAAETVGVERRAAYYEGAGALRDMVQNHLMQLLALVAMEPPIAFTAESVRDRKMDALLSVQPLGGSSTSCGRSIVAGWVAGSEVPAYRQEEGVAPGSTTETFVALRMQLDSWRWAGVPFYLRTGKRLPEAHDRNRDPVPPPAAARSSSESASRLSRPTSSSSTCSLTKASRSASRPNCRRRACSSRL